MKGKDIFLSVQIFELTGQLAVCGVAITPRSWS